MKKNMKEYISRVYDAPRPMQKKEFLQKLNYPKTRWQDFIVCQLGYIDKKVWIISILLFSVILFFETIFTQGDMNLLWVVSSFIPFIALMTITELARSVTFGMAELELTTRYNLRSVLLMRMGVLGVGNLVLLFAAIPILIMKLNMGIIKLGVYFLVPYLLTCFLSYVLARRIRPGEISLCCAGVAALISVFGLVVKQHKSITFTSINTLLCGF